MTPPVVIVGAGLAGLGAALELNRRDIPVKVLDAAEAPGGRVRSDRVEGFVLDRGFQIYLTAYPEGRWALDLDALEMKPFAPGALVRTGGGFHRVGDPLRRPGDLIGSVRAPIGSLLDKMKIAALGGRARFGDPVADLHAPDMSTREYLRKLRFSDEMVERFIRPLFAGIFLDADLETSSRMFRFVFRMLATGDSAVPAQGMQAIPDQMAARLPPGTLTLGTAVERIEPGGVTTADGREIDASAVIAAVEGPAASRLIGVEDPGSRSVSCVYFAADEPPFPGPFIVLNGEGEGPVTSVAVMSNVSPTYAPPGSALISVASLEDTEDIADEVRAQLSTWYGSKADGWRHLRTYRIPHAQPRQVAPLQPATHPLHESGVFVAGDYRTTASINGALESGRLAAEAVIAAR